MACGLFLAAEPALAEIHDHEIRRLLYLNSSCGVDELARLKSKETERLFKVRCRNASAFPEGVVVRCTDINDDRSCRLETQEQNFESLDLLSPDKRPP